MKLWSNEVDARLKPIPIGEAKTFTMIEVQRRSREFSLSAEMGMPDRSGHTGLDEIPDDDTQLTMRRLFSENGVSPINSDLLPNNSSSTSPTLPLVLITTLVNFYLSQLKLSRSIVYILPTRLISLLVEIVVAVQVPKDRHNQPPKDLHLSHEFDRVYLEIWWDPLLDIMSSMGKGMKMQKNIGICVRPSGDPTIIWMP